MTFHNARSHLTVDSASIACAHTVLSGNLVPMRFT